MNNNQNYNYDYDSSEDKGRRYRNENKAVNRYDSQDNFDVSQPERRRQPNPQMYGGSVTPQNRPQRPVSRDPRYYDPRRQYPTDSGAYQNSRSQYDDGYDMQNVRRQRNRQYNDNYGYYDNQRPMTPQKKKTSGVVITIRVISVMLLLVGLGIVGFKLFNYIKDGQGHKELKALSADFDALYARNNDFFGWLKIENTDIDYPVLYSPDEPERYLHADFDRDYSESGELFMDAECDPNGYHYLIYGHHMFNGSMFGSLPKYEEKDFYDSHRTLRFDTRSEMGEYEIFAVFYSQIYDESSDIFKYYNCTNLNSEDAYNYYVANVKALSVYDTGVNPVYGEKIVTLSTCNYHTDDGRFVVCARRIN